MFESLRAWINIPYQRRKFVGNAPTGTKLFEVTPIDNLCYPVGKVQLITDYRGASVVSNSQLYIPGGTELDVQDNIIFEGLDRPIKNISTFYRNGQVDIKVVYL